MFGDSRSPFNRFLSFDELFTIKFIRIIFIAGLILSTLSAFLLGLAVVISAIQFIGTGDMSKMVTGVITLVVGMLANLLGYITSVIFWRMYCEFIVVAFKINENLQNLRDSRSGL